MSGSTHGQSRQPEPYHPLEEEVFLNLQRTADAVLRQTAALLKTADLSPAQYNVLRVLRASGSGGLKCRELAGKMVTRDPDMTRLLDRMEKRGLIARQRQSRDRRVVETKVTVAGLDLLESLDEPMQSVIQRVLAHMDRPSLRRLNLLLEEAREGS